MDDLIGAYMMMLVVILAYFWMMGISAWKIKFRKMLGLMKNRIIAKEFGKDGYMHTFAPKIENRRVKLGRKKSYSYDIKKTFLNEYGLREGYFSQISGEQVNPIDIKVRGASLTPDEISDMLIMATVIAQMPKKPLSSTSFPWIILLAIVGIVIFFMSGGFQK